MLGWAPPRSNARIIVGWCVFLAAPLVLLLRQVGSGPLRSLWAEDGPLFLADAEQFGILRSASRTYVGYLHLPARLVAEAATHVPLRHAPLVMSGAATLLGAMVAWLVYRSATERMRSTVIPVALAAAVVALPAARAEVLSNISNVHWYLLYGAVWALVLPPSGRLASAVGAVVVFAAVTGDPLTLLLVPLAALRVVTHPATVRDQAITAAFAAGAVLQTVAVLTAPRMASTHPETLLALGKAFAARATTAAVTGEHTTAVVLDHAGWAPIVFGMVLVVGGALWGARRARGEAGQLVVIFVAAAVLLFLVPMVLRWNETYAPGVVPPDRLGLGNRYFVVPNLCILGALAMLADRAWSARGRPSAAGVVVVLAAVAAAWAPDFDGGPERADAPSWPTALREAGAACDHWGAAGAVRVLVPIAPPGWAVPVDCTAVRQASETADP